MQTALIIVDMQIDFFRRDPLKSIGRELVPAMNRLTSEARMRQVPVIWIRQEFKKDLSDAFLHMRRAGQRLTIEGTEGARLLPELNIGSDDFQIVKKRYSAFFDTNLDDLLNSMGIGSLIFCGINSHACVRASVTDAYQRDYIVHLVTDCTGSWDPEHHRISMNYMNVRMCDLMDVDSAVGSMG